MPKCVFVLAEQWPADTMPIWQNRGLRAPAGSIQLEYIYIYIYRHCGVDMFFSSQNFKVILGSVNRHIRISWKFSPGTGWVHCLLLFVCLIFGGWGQGSKLWIRPRNWPPRRLQMQNQRRIRCLPDPNAKSPGTKLVFAYPSNPGIRIS